MGEMTDHTIHPEGAAITPVMNELAGSRINSSDDPFAGYPQDQLPTFNNVPSNLNYEKSKKDYWNFKLDIKPFPFRTPVDGLKKKKSEYRALIEILEYAAKKDNKIKVTIRESDNTLILFNSTYIDARSTLIEKYKKILLDLKRSDNNWLPKNGNLNTESAFCVVEKHLIGSDPISGEEIFAYRYWSRKGMISAVQSPRGGILYCNWTLDEEVANRESIGSEAKQSPRVQVIASEQEPAKAAMPEAAAPPKQPSKKELEKAAAKAKLDKKALMQSQADKVRDSFSEKIEILLKNWSDIPEFCGKSLRYKNPQGEEITVTQRNFSHPEDHSVISVGLPFITKIDGSYFLQFASIPSEQKSRHLPKREFEAEIRNYLEGEKAKLLGEQALNKAREHLDDYYAPVHFIDAVTLNELPERLESGGIVIGSRTYERMEISIDGFQFDTIPYVSTMKEDDENIYLVVKYSFPEDLPVVDFSEIEPAIEFSKEGLRKLEAKDFKRKRDTLIHLRRKHSVDVNPRFVHIDEYPEIRDDGSFTLKTHTGDMNFEPITFTHIADEDVKHTGYPYLKRNIEDSTYSVRFTSSLEKAKEKHFPFGSFRNALFRHAYNQIPKSVLETLTEIDPAIVIRINELKWDDNRDIIIDSDHKIKSYLIESCGIIIRLYPSLVAKEVGGEIKLFVRYSRKSDPKDIDPGELAAAVEAATDKLEKLLASQKPRKEKAHRPVDSEDSAGTPRERRESARFRMSKQQLPNFISDLLFEDPDTLQSIMTKSEEIKAQIKDENLKEIFDSSFVDLFQSDERDTLCDEMLHALKSDKSLHALVGSKSRHLSSLEANGWKSPDKLVNSYAAYAFLDFVSKQFEGTVPQGDLDRFSKVLNDKTKSTNWIDDKSHDEIMEMLRVMTDHIIEKLKAD